MTPCSLVAQNVCSGVQHYPIRISNVDARCDQMNCDENFQTWGSDCVFLNIRQYFLPKLQIPNSGAVLYPNPVCRGGVHPWRWRAEKDQWHGMAHNHKSEACQMLHVSEAPPPDCLQEGKSLECDPHWNVCHSSSPYLLFNDIACHCVRV